MRRRSTLATLAATAVAVLLVTGCSSSGSDDPPAATEPTSTPTQAAQTAQDDLRSVLLPDEEHPSGTTVFQTTTLKEASALVLPGTGEVSGVVVMPRCMSYFAAIGGLGSMDGYHQFGLREDGTLFVNLVADAGDAAAAIELLRLRISSCGEGLMTIEGWPPSALNDEAANGTMAFEENEAPNIPGASVLSFTQTVTFHDPEDPTAQAVRQEWGCPDTPCTSHALVVGVGSTLIYVLEGEDLATEVATAMAERARA